MRKRTKRRRKAPSKQTGNTQQDPTNNRVPAQGFIKEESPGSRAHLCHIVKPKKRESLARKPASPSLPSVPDS